MALEIDSERGGGLRFLIVTATLVIIVGGIHLAQSSLVSFLVAVFFAMLGTQPVLWLERKGLPNVISVLLVMAGMIAILVVVGVIVGASITSFYTELPAYQTRLQEQLSSLQAFLASKGIRGYDKVFLGFFNPEAVLRMTASLFAGLGSVFSDIALILLTVAFILFEASSFPEKLRRVHGNPHEEFPQFTKFFGDMQRYMFIHTFMSLVTGILIGIWLSLLGVDFPILWGFLAFLLNYIPNVGSMIASIPGVLFALVQLGIGSAAMAFGGYLVINFFISNVIELKIMGGRLGLSTLVVFLSLIFWGSLLGSVGMVLCIPLTLTVKFACENNKGTAWVAELLGNGTPREINGVGLD